MQLGWFTHVIGESPRTAYRDTIALAVAAEELGYGSFWVAQHHAGAFDGVLPSPLVLLAAVAQHTSTIRLGTAVITPALEDPLRLAEDAAVVDELSGGRLQLGVGAGSDAVASQLFGRRHADRHTDCRDAVEQLCGWLTGPELIPAAPGLRQRLWWATGSCHGVDAAAEAGAGLLSGRPGADAVPDLLRYRALAVQPRIALSRIVQRGETPGDVLARWSADPALAWGQELIVQTPGAQREVMRMLADEVLPELDAARLVTS
jgi:alkanesulfonate monooxygenase SsuD/methylene tetrahydromethanopterin reductase-like flavin-dependent oxidoreductase (luciferase family)